MRRLFVLFLAVVALAGCEDDFDFDKVRIELTQSDLEGTYWAELPGFKYVRYVNGKAVGFINDMNDSPGAPFCWLRSESYDYYYGDSVKTYSFLSHDNECTGALSTVRTRIDTENAVYSWFGSDGEQHDFNLITLTADTMRLENPIYGNIDPNDYYRTFTTRVRIKPDAALMERFANATMTIDEAYDFWWDYFDLDWPKPGN